MLNPALVGAGLREIFMFNTEPIINHNDGQKNDSKYNQALTKQAL